MQIDAVQIEAVQIDDLQPLWLQLHEHHQTVAPELQPFVDPVTSWKARRNLYVHAMETGGMIRVARDGERQVGYLVTSWEPSAWPATLVSPEKVMELVTIHVDPAYRGRGVGSSLLAAFDAELLRVGARQCFLGAIPGNSRAVELYLRRGFRATSFLMMRFGRELRQPIGGVPLAVDVVSVSEVESLRDVWVAAHRWRRSGGSSLGEFVSEEVSWDVIRKGLVEAAEAGLLFCAGGRGFAYAVMTDSAVLSDTWVTRPRVAEISIVTVPSAEGPARALLHFVEDALVRLDVTDHIVNVMASDTDTIQVCRDRGFLPGWLQLSRFAALGCRQSGGDFDPLRMSTPPIPSERLGRLLASIERDEGNLSLRKDAIREACNTGQWRIALELVEVGLHGHPGDSGLLAMAGMAHLLARQYVDAQQVLSAAVARGMEAPEVRYNLAFALFMQGRMSDALEVVAAPAVAEAVPAALLLRARCLHHFSRLKEAIADCRDLLAVLPGSADTHGFLALLLYDEGQSDGARRHAEMAMRYDPNQLEALLVRAYSYSDVREYDDARACFRTLLEAHPDCGRAWLGLALIDLAEMQLPAAKGNIELAARYLPQHIGTWHVFAWLQLIHQDVAGAEAAFQQALALDRNFAETHGGLAVVAVLQQRDDEARASIKRALRVDSQSVSAQYAQILLLQREGHQQEADSALGTVLARPMDREGNQLRELVNAHLATVRPSPRASAV